MKEKTYLTLNSAILYVVAFLITTMLHELSHALSMFGGSPRNEFGAGYLGCPQGPFGANHRFWNLISALFLPVALPLI